MILEKEAVKGLCEMDHETSEELQALKRIWLVPVEEYKQETKQILFNACSSSDVSWSISQRPLTASFLNHAQIKQLIIKLKIQGFDFPPPTEMYINVVFLF